MKIDPTNPAFLAAMNREWLNVIHTRNPDKAPEMIATWARWPGDRAAPSSPDFIAGFCAGTVYAESVFKEKAACSPASPAPSDGASASSGGTVGSRAGTGSGTGTARPTSTPARTSDAGPVRLSVNQFCAVCHGRGTVGGEECDCVYAVDGQPSDPSAAIRADPGRPKWLTEAMLPLPVGTERVRRATNGLHRAYPVKRQWWNGNWDAESSREDVVVSRQQWYDDANEVYHVPPPQPEKAMNKHEALYDAARKFILSSRFEEDNATQQALAEAVRQLTPIRDDPVHDTHARPEKPKPAAASAWEEQGAPFERWLALGMREGSFDHMLNQFVRAECKAAVEASKPKCGTCDVTMTGHYCQNPECSQSPPKPDAGRAEGVRCPGCGKVAHPTVKHGQFFCSDAECSRRWLSFEPIPAPKPRRAPEVVAREIASAWADHYGAYPTKTYDDVLKFTAAAVRADRGEA